MSGFPQRQVLVSGVEDPVYNAVVNVLSPLGFDIHRAPWEGVLSEHVQITPFDIIVLGLQPEGGALSTFLKALRAEGSACHSSGVIIIAPHPVTELAERHLGRGANKVVGERDVSAKLQRTVLDLVGIAPRVPVTMNARIKIHVPGKPVQSFCQTQNLSRSGVLIRGFSHYDPGLRIDFEISLPDDSAPLRGRGVIRRQTERRNEGIDGLGIEFESFHGADQQRLVEFLAAERQASA